MHDEAIGTFRSLRRELEDVVLPLAGSLDGRRFEFQAPIHDLRVALGGYVRIGTGEERRLGQITSLRLELQDGPAFDLPMGGGGQIARTEVHFRAARGEGVLLGSSGPFTDAPMEPAPADEVAARLAAGRFRGAALGIGELRLAEGVPFALDAAGFGRHTFLCGQSGSGKTYSLGLLLERLMLETELRIVVLDPNSDFARMAETRADAEPGAAAAWRAIAGGIDVRSGDGLRLRIGELEAGTRAAILRLDPIADREEYAAYVAAIADAPTGLDRLEASEDPIAAALLQRIGNLGLTDWPIWARERGGSVLGALADPDLRMLVVDLGSLGARDQQAVVAAGVLGELWRRRTDRRPTLVVIDEAHNVCPAVAPDAITAAAVRDTIAIAAEGRKFGLHLLVSTQRPQKIHENVLSPVREPRADAAQQRRRRRLRAAGVLVRAARAARARRVVPPGRGGRRGDDRVACRAGPLRAPRGRGGRRRRARRLGRPRSLSGWFGARNQFASVIGSGSSRPRRRRPAPSPACR